MTHSPPTAPTASGAEECRYSGFAEGGTEGKDRPTARTSQFEHLRLTQENSQATNTRAYLT